MMVSLYIQIRWICIVNCYGQQILILIMFCFSSLKKLMCWFWICRFLLISSGIIYGYYAMILKIDEEDFGGHTALLQEGLFASITLFLVLWDLSVSASLSHTHKPIHEASGYILWKRERGLVLVPDSLLLFFSWHGFLYTAWHTSDWLGANDSATISLSQVMYEQSWLHYTPWLVLWEQWEFLTLSFAF